MAESTTSPIKISALKKVIDKLKPSHAVTKMNKTSSKGKKNTLFYTTDAPINQPNLENSPKINSSTESEKIQMVKVSEPTPSTSAVKFANVTDEKTSKNFRAKDLINSSSSVINYKSEKIIQNQTFDNIQTPKNAKRTLEEVGVSPATCKVANTNASISADSSSNDSESLQIDEESEENDQFQPVILHKTNKALKAKISLQSTQPPTYSNEDISDTTHAVGGNRTVPLSNNQLVLFVKGKYSNSRMTK
jgi:hypothetical protein